MITSCFMIEFELIAKVLNPLHNEFIDLDTFIIFVTDAMLFDFDLRKRRLQSIKGTTIFLRNIQTIYV